MLHDNLLHRRFCFLRNGVCCRCCLLAGGSSGFLAALGGCIGILILLFLVKLRTDCF